MSTPFPFTAQELANTTYNNLKQQGQLKAWYTNHKGVKNLDLENNLLDQVTKILLDRLTVEGLCD
jgi:hypothetical protein